MPFTIKAKWLIKIVACIGENELPLLNKIFRKMDCTMRDELKIRTADVRKVLGIAPATMTDLAKKHQIRMTGGSGIKSKFMDSSEVRRLFESRGVTYNTESRIIAFMICKGGTGKSSSTYYLSMRLASYGNNVLVIDADPQGNLTRAYNLPKDGYDLTKIGVLVDLIRKEADLDEVLIEAYPNLHLIPSNPRNSVLENAIRDNFKNPSLPLRQILKPLRKVYDYILIDCAPSLNLTNTAVVSAADMVILPVNPDDFSMMSLNQTLVLTAMRNCG